jgi:hypothetical protein
MKRAKETLQEENVMSKGRGGYLHHGDRSQSRADQFVATDWLIKEFCQSLYDESGDFDNSSQEYLYRFEYFSPYDIPALSSYEDKLETIRRYNQFIRGFSFAMKSPSYRTIKDFDGRSGRIVNNFQSIAERRIKIRTRTLIDGSRISEPDFSSNHLRMAATLIGEELPDDPYLMIANQLGTQRDIVKAVVTRCLGAPSLRSKGSLFSQASRKSPSMSTDLFREILNTLDKEFTFVSQLFFKDVGVRMQYLEGEIALKMMNWACDEQLPLLVVHDQYAVKVSDHDRTFETMKDFWQEVIDDAVKTDFLGVTARDVGSAMERKKLRREASRNNN